MTESLTAQEIQEYTRIFNQFDENGDGKISKEEFCKIMGALTQKSPPDSGFDNMDIQTFLEFIVEYNNNEASLQDVQQVFEIFDKDKNGFIDIFEMKEVMNVLGYDLNEEEIKDMFDEADFNKDGKVSFEEFKNLWCELDK